MSRQQGGKMRKLKGLVCNHLHAFEWYQVTFCIVSLVTGSWLDTLFNKWGDAELVLPQSPPKLNKTKCLTVITRDLVAL